MCIGRDIFPHCCIFRFSLAPVKFLAPWSHSTGRAPGDHVLIRIFDRWGNRGLASHLADVIQLDIEPDAVTTIWCSVYSMMLLENRTQPNRDRWKDNSKSVKGFQGGECVANRSGKLGTGSRAGHGSRAEKESRNSEVKVLESNYLPVPSCCPYSLPIALGQSQKVKWHQAGSQSLFYYLVCGLFPFPNGYMSSCPWKKSWSLK